jgi:UDPglucose 6-dehydrogenase
MLVGIAGAGFVGGAMSESFHQKQIEHIVYDKYKNMGSVSDLLDAELIFLCLPTKFREEAGYDKSAIYEVCDQLEDLNYSGTVVLKSTVEPGSTRTIAEKYSFEILHNPEFLTARTAFQDFHSQTHCVIGGQNLKSQGVKTLFSFYRDHYPQARISISTSDESEAMKIFCNNFYAMKVMIFNEFYDVCQKSDISFTSVVDLMLRNNWINPMHTKVPGPDGKLAYGGACFTKDTNALLEHAKRTGSMHNVLEAAIKERNMLRDDDVNILKQDEE